MLPRVRVVRDDAKREGRPPIEQCHLSRSVLIALRRRGAFPVQCGFVSIRLSCTSRAPTVKLPFINIAPAVYLSAETF